MKIAKISIFLIAIVFSLSQNAYSMGKKPKNFAWLIDGKICGMALPTKQAHLKWVENQNVILVVTLTEDDLSDRLFEGTNLARLYIPVEDFETPTFEQVNLLVEKTMATIATGKAVVVHCFAGIGRTGTMLACWLVATQHMNAQDAVALVREKRPGSIDTQEQEDFVAVYQAYLLVCKQSEDNA